MIHTGNINVSWEVAKTPAKFLSITACFNDEKTRYPKPKYFF